MIKSSINVGVNTDIVRGLNYEAEVLMDLVGKMKRQRGSGRLFLVSTTCRCHGVTSALWFC